jgi:DNA-binding MarR family transcriptional regulator
MDEKQFAELMDSLKGLESKLNVLINLQRAGLPKSKVSREERKILRLCDRKHTIDDIGKETGKTSGNVRKILTQLRKKGFIVSVRSEGKVVFRRT